jgi:hypothetical protein
MNDMRGIEFDVNGGGVHFVPPLQGGGELFMDIYLGLGAERLTPGYHITGFQPLRANPVFAELDALIPAIFDKAFKGDL